MYNFPALSLFKISHITKLLTSLSFNNVGTSHSDETNTHISMIFINKKKIPFFLIKSNLFRSMIIESIFNHPVGLAQIWSYW